MVFEHRSQRILMASWICGLRRDKPEGWEVKTQTIKECLARLGVDLTGFDEEIEDTWKRHYAPLPPNPIKKSRTPWLLS